MRYPVFMLLFASSRGFSSLNHRLLRLGKHSSSCLLSSKRSTSSTTDPNTAAGIPSIPSILLKRNRQSKSFRDGNQLVFSKAIETVPSEPLQVGDLVQISVPRDSGVDLLGYGVFNPHSMYRIRFVCHRYVQTSLFRKVQLLEEPAEVLRTILRHHIETAQKLRKGLISDATDTYRLINGEGDSLSGLAVDIIGPNHAVVMSSALWCQVHQTVILEELQSLLGSDVQLIWRTTPNRLEQDGSTHLEDKTILQSHDTTSATASFGSERVVYRENNVLFATYPFDKGQKTSVYCDQRENRLHMATLAKDKTVLDLCCYQAGFSLTCLVHGGARSAVAVDSSTDALKGAADNAALNQVELECVQADISEFLKDMHGEQSWDIVILDPPKLAPNTQTLDKARRKYHALNRDAILAMSEDGGYLMTCTCSAAMTQKEGGQYFLEMVQGAALAAGRQVTLLRVSGAASCHTQSPISWPAGNYLTAAIFYVHALE